MNREKQKVYLRMQKQSLTTCKNLITYGQRQMLDVPGSKTAYNHVNEVLNTLLNIIKSDITCADAELQILELNDSIKKADDIIRQNDEMIRNRVNDIRSDDYE